MTDHANNIHERFLRHIWSRQYLETTKLRTRDGRTVVVLRAGALNLDGGPDFVEAKIRIGPTTYVGDVEIHRTVADWFSHQHHYDPRYNRVILHVVLEGGTRPLDTTSFSGRTIPVLILSDFLSESIQSVWQKAILDERARRSETIKCYRRNDAVDDPALSSWLRKLATERLELKLRRFEERLKELAYERLMEVREHARTYGEPPVEGFPEEIPPPYQELTQRDFSSKELWEQVLYEGLMEGLGYAKNRDPFLRLARSITLRRVGEFQLARDEKRREALLFAVAGLLPKIKSMKERDSREYVRTLTRAWSEMRRSVHTETLHASDWQFFPTRPNNFPTVRISAANTLIGRLLNENLFRDIIQTLKSDDVDRPRKSLTKLISIQSNPFWIHHYDFDQPTRKNVVTLGLSRINELLVNTVIPIALLYARVFKDSVVREHALRFYESFPPVEENTLTRLMQRQLLRNRVPLDSASRQQAVIQLYKFYCAQARCHECEIGKILFAGD